MQEQKPKKMLRQIALKQLLILLKQQYDSKSYNINQSIRDAIDIVLRDQIIQSTTTIEEESIKQKGQQVEQIDQKKINQEIELQLFCIGLVIGRSPGIWINLLENDQIQSQKSEIIISSASTLTKVYRTVANQINKELKIENASNLDFESLYMNGDNYFLFAQLLFSIACQICQSYEESALVVKSKLKKIEKKIQKSKLMNTYFLFAILKQETANIESQIQILMIETLFRNSSSQPNQLFTQYILKNYDRLILICDTQIEPKIFTKKQEKVHDGNKKDEWLNYLNDHGDKLQLKRLQSKQGEQAFLLVDKKGEKDQRSSGVILHFVEGDKIQVTNTKTTQKSWYALDAGDSVSQLKGMLKKNKLPDLKPNADFLNQAVAIDAYATVGGDLGKCLANINRYKNPNQFFVDLSKKTAVSGSTMLLLMEIPILSYFFIAGGFSYSFYQAFSNEATNNPKKFQQLGKATAKALGTAGSSIAGMAIGQILIPVPVLGAFVGGVIGGFLGEKGTKQIANVLEKSEFKSVMKFLRLNHIKGQSWEYSFALLKKLGINEKYFEKTNPAKNQSKNQWATAVCFCIISLYESKKYEKFTKQKLKEAEKEQKKIEPGKEEIFENEFNIVAITDYLSTHNISIMKNIDTLQQLVGHLLN